MLMWCRFDIIQSYFQPYELDTGFVSDTHSVVCSIALRQSLGSTGWASKMKEIEKMAGYRTAVVKGLFLAFMAVSASPSWRKAAQASVLN